MRGCWSNVFRNKRKKEKKRERKSWAGAEKYPSWSSSLWREDTLRIHSLCRIADSESFYSWLWRDRRSSSSGASFWFLLQIRWVCLRQKEEEKEKRLIALISCSLTLRYHCFEIIFPTNLQISVTRYFSALIICPLLSVWREWGVAGWSMSCQRISHKRLSLLWEGAALSLWLCWCCCWTSRAATATGAATAGRGNGSPGSLGWLLSDKGPFQQSLEYTEAAERYQQGFSTRYKIYRWEVCVFNACNVLCVREFQVWIISRLLAIFFIPDVLLDNFTDEQFQQESNLSVTAAAVVCVECNPAHSQDCSHRYRTCTKLVASWWANQKNCCKHAEGPFLLKAHLSSE